jgi:pyruvate/2-oxoglutarate dehydrogenase complex dihydrolipoamide acyltransferase (E2) component
MTNSTDFREPGGGPFRRIAFPPERRLVLDTLHLGHRKPMMHGMIELDITRARRLLREHRERTGESVSFTAFVLACLGRAVAAHPEVHALRDWRGRMVLFNDVDATTMIEVKVEDRPFALAHVIRGINRRDVRDISDEIRSVQTAGVDSLSSGLRKGSSLFLKLPGFLRRLVLRLLLCSPRFTKRHTGTMMVTAVGMFSNGSGWGFTAPGIHNLSIVIGGIATRPSVSPTESGQREFLCLSVSANHEVVDGAPLARFVSSLKEQIEAADLLSSDHLMPSPILS